MSENNISLCQYVDMSECQYVRMSICQKATFQLRYQHESCERVSERERESERVCEREAENLYGQPKSPLLFYLLL